MTISDYLVFAGVLLFGIGLGCFGFFCYVVKKGEVSDGRVRFPINPPDETLQVLRTEKKMNKQRGPADDIIAVELSTAHIDDLSRTMIENRYLFTISPEKPGAQKALSALNDLIGYAQLERVRNRTLPSIKTKKL